MEMAVVKKAGINKIGFSCAVAGLAVGLVSAAWGQGAIYTCVDAKGRKLTSDRPIPECTDRTQKELNPSGTVKRQMGPTLTGDERLQQVEAARKAEEERLRQVELRKRDRALFFRYPNQAAHDKERNEAAEKVEESIRTSKRRLEELALQRQKMVADDAKHKKDGTRAPASLKHELDENSALSSAQHRFISDKEAEKRRVHARFDEELTLLRPQWDQKAQ